VVRHATEGTLAIAVARLFSRTPVRWLGNMSYSYYLVHGLKLHAFFMLLAMVRPAAQLTVFGILGLMALAFVATLPPAVALFLAIERPWSLTSRSRRYKAGVASSLQS
jgi:peptidoglycan/LPS O-acetylase OafA/YrhL